MLLVLAVCFVGTTDRITNLNSTVHSVEVQNRELNTRVNTLRRQTYALERANGKMDDQVGVLNTSYAALKKRCLGRN
jgi:cell division protein FtsL